jgi:chromate reductase, NAD(P)H dehydrogenase (quinone)
MSLPTVLGICGSLRMESLNRRLLHAATEALPDVDWSIARIRAIPAYDADVEARGIPPAVLRLKEQIADADAVVIATPEYNHSVPGVLKNAIDWASRPAMRSPFVDKPVLMMSASPGRGGGRRALDHLRQVLESMRAEPLLLEVSVPSARERLGPDGPDDQLAEELERALRSLPIERRAPVAVG